MQRLQYIIGFNVYLVKESVKMRKNFYLQFKSISALKVIFLSFGLWGGHYRVASAKVSGNSHVETPPRFKMASIDIEIEGEVKTYLNGDTIYAFPHQKLKILDAILYSKYGASYVNLVGYKNNREDKGIDDRGIFFSEKDMIKKWAINPEKTKYKIEIKKKNYLSGMVFLQFVEPEIEYVELHINDKRRIIRHGDMLDLFETDSFKMGKIKLNLPTSKGLKYRLTELKRQNQTASTEEFLAANGKFFELILTLKERPLMVIPMKVRSK